MAAIYYRIDRVDTQYLATAPEFMDSVGVGQSKKQALDDLKVSLLASYNFLAADTLALIPLFPGSRRAEKRHKTDWKTDDAGKVYGRILDRDELLNVALDGQPEIADQTAIALEASALKKGNVNPKYARPIGDTAKAIQFRLAVTNLFVEKAQFHLEQRAAEYRRLGLGLYIVSVIVIVIGMGLAVNKYLDLHSPVERRINLGWEELIYRFTVAFTTFGLIVLLAVILVKGAKACYDQRERLLTRRHSLRQGRLYLHLNAGLCSLEEMQKVFDWNNSQTNAFTELDVNMKAPWGKFLEELIKVVPDLVKTGVEAGQGKKTVKTDKSDGE